MEDSSWEQKVHAVTHVLTTPTTSPRLHSQLLISTLLPCYLNWDYPPLLCRDSPHLLWRWAVSQFLKRASRFGLPQTSWRSKCPYQIPPPLVLAKGVDMARWEEEEEKRKYVGQRLRRRRLGSDINPLLPIFVPNILLFALLFWDPFPVD